MVEGLLILQLSKYPLTTHLFAKLINLGVYKHDAIERRVRPYKAHRSIKRKTIEGSKGVLFQKGKGQSHQLILIEVAI